jgi:hypothetical protein
MSRTLRTLAALALVVLIIAGCSNAPAETDNGGSTGNNTAAPVETVTGNSNGNNTPTNQEQAVKFADCMRKNGVSEFPDPDASGDLTIERVVNGTSLDTDSAAFKRALDACKDLEPAGFTGAVRSAEQQKAALEFAQCIRDNGVKDFPDPNIDGPLVDTNRIPSTARNGGMSALHAAMTKCRDLARAAGVTGGQ